MEGGCVDAGCVRGGGTTGSEEEDELEASGWLADDVDVGADGGGLELRG